MSEILFKPKLLYRKRLKNMLSNIFHKPLFLLIAPIGYGKTNAVKNFLNTQNNFQQIWFIMGGDITDELWVWNKLCEIIEPVFPEIANKFVKQGLPKSEEEILIIIKILKENLKSPLIFVIDDFSDIKSKNLDILVEAIVNAYISNLHIVIISRNYPEFSYKKLCKKGSCFLMNKNDISFTLEEQILFFELNGFKLNEEEQNKLFKQTDGWTSAIYLSMIYYSQEHSFNNFTSYTNLIKSTMFDKLNNDTKNAIMSLSILDSFTSEQALFITKNLEVIHNIHKIAIDNCFIKYDNKTDTYRLHTLLKIVAFEELEESNINIELLYNLCGDWYIKENEIILAITYYHKAKNHEKILYVIEHYSNKIFSIAPMVILNAFNDIPKIRGLDYPLANIVFVQFYIININIKEGIDMLYRVKEGYQRITNQIETKEKNLLLGEIAILEAFINFNDISKVIDYLKEAYRLFNGGHSRLHYDDLIYTLGVPYTLYLYHKEIGELSKVVKILQNDFCYYSKVIYPHDLGYEYLIQAEYYFEIGEFNKVEFFALKAKNKAIEKSQFNILISSLYVLAKISILNGDINEFTKCINHVNNIKGNISTFLNNDIDLFLGYIYSCIEQIDKIPKWIVDYDFSQCNYFVCEIGYTDIIYAKVLFSQKKFIELEIFAEAILKASQQKNYILGQIVAYIFDSIAKYNLYSLEIAKNSMIEALKLAEPDNIVMVFVENIYDTTDILNDIENNHAKKILYICEKFKRGVNKINIIESINTLTTREREIINLVANGYKNSEIGEQLGIAPVTVEKILSNIYKKLDVKNRVAAVTKVKIL